jgi:deoxyribose-phosphate aldolase
VSAPITAAALAARVDHAVLAPEATRSEVAAAAAAAAGWGCASVCVQPSMVDTAVEVVGRRLAVCAVVGFPHGAALPAVKAVEAAFAVSQGAGELDVVVDLAAIAEDDLDALAAEVARVREAAPGVLLKAIVESALWSAPQLRAACEAAIAGGADFVKTSTGFHPAGGATLEAVGTMRAAVGRRAGVKASGGIRSAAEALALIEAGADRLGLSATATILAEL